MEIWKMYGHFSSIFFAFFWKGIHWSSSSLQDWERDWELKLRMTRRKGNMSLQDDSTVSFKSSSVFQSKLIFITVILHQNFDKKNKMLEALEIKTKFSVQEMTETEKRNRQKTDSIWICLQNIFYKKSWYKAFCSYLNIGESIKGWWIREKRVAVWKLDGLLHNLDVAYMCLWVSVCVWACVWVCVWVSVCVSVSVSVCASS